MLLKSQTEMSKKVLKRRLGLWQKHLFPYIVQNHSLTTSQSKVVGLKALIFSASLYWDIVKMGKRKCSV